MKCCTLNKDYLLLQYWRGGYFPLLVACPKYVIERDKLQSVVLRYALFTVCTLLEVSDHCSEMDNGVMALSVITYSV